MSNDYQKALGRKIAQHRKRRGLSQREFARLVERSEAWVSQVERGVRRIDRMSVLETVADALEVPLSELAAEAPVVASAAEEAPGSSRLRLVLSRAHALRAMLSAGGEPPDVDALGRKVDHVWELTHTSRYLDLTEALEPLIPELEAAARSVPNGQRVPLFRLLNSAYQACSSALTKLGEYEAAWIAADRSITAAERADDPLLMAAGEFRLCLTFQGAGYYEQVEATAGTSCEALSRLADKGDPEAMSLFGALTLQRAVAAARRNDATAAYRNVAHARSVADRLGGDRNDYNTEFGPTNVSLHEVAVAVELGDAGVALRAAEGVDASGLSPERQGRFLIDVARAHLQRRNADRAVSTLEKAEAITPEQVRTHPLVRQALGDLLTIQDPAGPALQGLARRAGVL
ncbi:helix-turn-helix domain-containing protein [Streptomonospora nanhaiensis]|uniref:Transcriptional regulator with XRE-family HTH domain n=1 Tax=Streptomonospora nanhaiensis TaxID=1323731 RepID=A0A853BGQ7_9ACTN|nr:helix-turn-helix transcriptional regulator [Streptomonospora nanhaiensis]MBV2364651.1 helix-turn-helix domain-containing protein [Streptomonospora nanhaiensis]MBX9390126.1 helix-turn-helix domain-containing protein [Streptomonospora nanhaiensis]NYI94658.1 transcriptional regulator with XRE-family HTH domain [Streptomonospora nanhaiensis]